MRPNTYTDELYTAQRLRHLEEQCHPRPDLGVLILGSYLLALGAFVSWVLA